MPPARHPVTSEPVIRAESLSKSYRRHHQDPGIHGALRAFAHRRTEERLALAPLDLEVAPGEFVGLLGPNGAGKTTVVKLCCGLVRPTAGTVSVLGHEPARRRAEFLQSIAVVFGQKSMLWWDVPTVDSMLVHKAMYALDGPTYRRRVGELTEVLSLSEVLDVPVRRLSLGERMRCELALSLLHSPRLLFADEPTIGLDVTAKQALRGMLARTNEALGTTVVLTSHDMDDVEALCRRILLVSGGHLTFDGDVAGLRARIAPRRLIRAVVENPLRPEDLPAGARLLDPRTIGLEASEEELEDAVASVLALGGLRDLSVQEVDLEAVMARAYSEQAGAGAERGQR
ncbi:ABC transporter ATP-binding protein [Brachybacterium sacelli]|uniref:ABC-2 type transport system ATP-binding protein n=1 Tax=Brachybacterium sacelli TaxID=173364 RepID=A0ABS4WX87_9MICO|nr:ATP-binding cassette domain-containing protein [Brachybacterium sacelli]MBP2380711.1 ABC-2 type transport system ATP-binding protein [Brachybacterium sacelli]